MEAAFYKKDKQAILQLYDQVLPALAERINNNLAQVISLFHNYWLERQVDTWTRAPHASATEEISLEKGNVQQIGLKLRLEGFERAGIPPFDVYKELLFCLEQDFYQVGPDKNTSWIEKPYLQDWTRQEYEEIANQWSEELIEAITKQLENLT